jgi:hypothetical protein
MLPWSYIVSRIQSDSRYFGMVFFDVVTIMILMWSLVACAYWNDAATLVLAIHVGFIVSKPAFAATLMQGNPPWHFVFGSAMVIVAVLLVMLLSSEVRVRTRQRMYHLKLTNILVLPKQQSNSVV